MIVLNIIGYFGLNKQNSYAALKLNPLYAIVAKKTIEIKWDVWVW